MTDHILARVARLSAAADGGWVCRTRLEHLDWRPLVDAGLAERTPTLGHVRLTPLGWARVHAWAAGRHVRASKIDPKFGGAARRAVG